MADKQTGKLDDSKLLTQFREDKKEAREGTNQWRRQALKAYRFYHGDQWDQGDLKVLFDQNRPAITFNRIKPFVQVVVGTMIQSRGVPKYLPRETSDRPRSDLFNNAAMWARDSGSYEHYETKAAKDMLICGQGVTDERVSYENGIIAGTMVKERIYPLEVFTDPGSVQMNRLDARYHFRCKHLSKRDFQDFFDEDPRTIGVGHEDMTIVYQDYYDDDAFKRYTGKYTAFEYQYRQKEKYFWTPNPAFNPEAAMNQGLIGADPQQLRQLEQEFGTDFGLAIGEFAEKPIEIEIAQEFARRFGKNIEEPVFAMTPKEYKVYRSLMAEADKDFMAKEAKRWQYYQAFIAGEKVMSHEKSPVPDGFSFKFMTGDYDDERGLFYGMVDAMIDPARYANKAFSQHLHILNTNPKGGIIAERGVTDNPAKLEKQYAKHDSVVWVKDGAISKGKLKDKAQPTQATGFELVLNIAQGAHREVTGVNLELLGQTDRQQAGVLEATRIQQGMTVLAEYLDSMKLYLKESGKATIHHLREMTSNVDGLLFRIVGTDEGKYVRLFEDDIAPYYDIVVTDAPASPNQDAEDIRAISELLRTGVVPPLKSLVKGVVEKAPIRQALKDEAVAEINQASQTQPDPQQAAQQQALQNEAIQLERADKIADIKKKEAEAAETTMDTYKKQAEAALTQAEAARKGQEVKAIAQTTGIR